MTDWIVLLRGINVGGNKKVAMADLRSTLESLGHKNVRTVLQSGNVVLRSDEASGSELEASLKKSLATRLAIECEVFARTAEEWGEVIKSNPFEREAEADPSHTLVVLLKERPSEDALGLVTSSYEGPEQFDRGSRHLYVVYPEGIGESKLTTNPAWKKLAGAGTGRNWNTVLKLRDLVRGPDSK